MSEPIWTRMQIGGTLSQEKYNKLCALINDEFSDGDIEFTKGKSLIAYGNVNYGLPDDVEDFCKENGLSFSRHNDASFDSDAETYYWDASIKELYMELSNQSGGRLTYIEAARDLAEVAIAVAENGPSALTLFLGKNEELDQRLGKMMKKEQKGIIEALKSWMNEMLPLPHEIPPLVIQE